MTPYDPSETPEKEVLLESIENEARVRIVSYKVNVSEEQTAAEVELRHDGEPIVGRSEVFGRVGTPELLARACLDGLEKLLQGRVALRLGGLQHGRIMDVEIVTVIVQESEGRDERTRVGSAIVGDDPARAGMYAALQAMNRRLGVLLIHPPQNYEIK